jgi:hypothetical protein
MDSKSIGVMTNPTDQTMSKEINVFLIHKKYEALKKRIGMNTDWDEPGLGINRDWDEHGLGRTWIGNQ